VHKDTLLLILSAALLLYLIYALLWPERLG
jgi:K+-transporting ATPase KdpF subunit